MIKEFKMNEILEAVNIISSLDKKKTKNVEKKDFIDKKAISTTTNPEELNKSEILVLNEMIE